MAIEDYYKFRSFAYASGVDPAPIRDLLLDIFARCARGGRERRDIEFFFVD
jgi:hypothetical protein